MCLYIYICIVNASIPFETFIQSSQSSMKSHFYDMVSFSVQTLHVPRMCIKLPRIAHAKDLSHCARDRVKLGHGPLSGELYLDL